MIPRPPSSTRTATRFPSTALFRSAETVDKQPFPLILQRRILDPLGMASTAPQIDDRLRRKMATSYARAPNGDLVVAPWFEHLAADGAIVSTAPDLSSAAHTSELKSLMRISYAVFCLKKKTNT